MQEKYVSNTNRLVLLIVDQPEDLEILSQEMKNRGIQFLVASDGSKALELIEKEMPSVIVSGFKMSGLNGLELLRFMRNINYWVPVIWFIENANNVVKKEAWQLGVFHLFEKPFEPELLGTEVLKALNITPELWQKIQPTFLTESYYEKSYQKLNLMIEKDLYLKFKEHCLDNSLSISTFVNNLLREVIQK